MNHAPNHLFDIGDGLHKFNLMLNRHLKTWLVRKGSMIDRLCDKREGECGILRVWVGFSLMVGGGEGGWYNGVDI